MKKYQITIHIDNNLGKDYVDSLIVALARQGYEVYFDIDGNVCFNGTEEEVFEVKEK